MRRLKAYQKADEMKQQREDYSRWWTGHYIMQAIAATIGNSAWFKGENTPPHEYPEKPFLLSAVENTNEPVLTESEIEQQTDDLFRMLEVMQKNFENTHGSKGGAE